MSVETTHSAAPLDVAGLRGMLSGWATPGPWAESCLGSEGYAINGPQQETRRIPRVAFLGNEAWETDKANAALIVAMRNNAEALLDAADRAAAAQAELAALRGRLEAVSGELTAAVARSIKEDPHGSPGYWSAVGLAGAEAKLRAALSSESSELAIAEARLDAAKRVVVEFRSQNPAGRAEQAEHVAECEERVRELRAALRDGPTGGGAAGAASQESEATRC